MNRRSFLGGLLAVAGSRLAFPYAADPGVSFRLADVTAGAGIHFQHNSGAFGAKNGSQSGTESRTSSSTLPANSAATSIASV